MSGFVHAWKWGGSPFLEWVGWVPLGWHDYEEETSQAAKVAWLEENFCGERALAITPWSDWFSTWYR